jgi:hypothetical protein
VNSTVEHATCLECQAQKDIFEEINLFRKQPFSHNNSNKYIRLTWNGTNESFSSVHGVTAVRRHLTKKRVPRLTLTFRKLHNLSYYMKLIDIEECDEKQRPYFRNALIQKNERRDCMCPEHSI